MKKPTKEQTKFAGGISLIIVSLGALTLVYPTIAIPALMFFVGCLMLKK